MKKLFLLLLLVALMSCEITEKVYINPDNSARYALALDVTQISQMMAMEPNHAGKNFPVDTVMTIQEFVETDYFGSKNKHANSKEEHELQQIFDEFKVYAKLNEKEGFFSFFTEKKNISELNSTLSTFHQKINESRAKKENAESKDEEMLMSEIMGNLELNFDGKKFSRKGKMDFNKLQKEGGFTDGDFGEFAGMINYTLEYHFPRPVKSISDTTVLMSWDRKTIYLRKSFSEILSNPKAYDFTLELED